MAQYAVLLYGTETAEPDAAERRRHDEYADDMVSAGVLVAGYALTPRDMATSVRADAVTDGPFIDSKEVVVGFYILDVPDLDAALEIAGRNPIVAAGGGVEVRPIEAGGPVEPRRV